MPEKAEERAKGSKEEKESGNGRERRKESRSPKTRTKGIRSRTGTEGHPPHQEREMGGRRSNCQFE